MLKQILIIYFAVLSSFAYSMDNAHSNIDPFSSPVEPAQKRAFCQKLYDLLKSNAASQGEYKDGQQLSLVPANSGQPSTELLSLGARLLLTSATSCFEVIGMEIEAIRQLNPNPSSPLHEETDDHIKTAENTLQIAEFYLSSCKNLLASYPIISDQAIKDYLQLLLRQPEQAKILLQSCKHKLCLLADPASLMTEFDIRSRDDLDLLIRLLPLGKIRRVSSNALMDSIGLQDADIERLANALKNDTRVWQLRVFSENMTDRSANALAEMLTKNKALTVLHLHGRGQAKITEAGDQTLFEAFKQNIFMVRLELQNFREPMSCELHSKMEAELAFRRELNLTPAFLEVFLCCPEIPAEVIQMLLQFLNCVEGGHNSGKRCSII